jgi:hypothetical protein
MNTQSEPAVDHENTDTPAGAAVDEMQEYIESLSSGGTTRHEFPVGPASTPKGMRLEAALLLLAHVLPLLTFAVCRHPAPKLPRERIDEHWKLIRAACEKGDHRLQHEPIAVDGAAAYYGMAEVLSLVLAHFLDAKRAHSRDPERALFAAAEPAFKDLDWG